jgi:hypothetical protein
MSVQGDIRLTDDWIKVKNLIKEHLFALSEALAGRINEYAPDGQILKGSFAPNELIDDGKQLSIDVGTPLQYGEYVEFGTKPHWAPIQPLINWAENNVQIHLKAIGIEFKEGRVLPTRKGTKKLTGDKKKREILNFAYAVRASIAKKGTKAQKFMERALIELGLPYKNVFDATGATYEIDISAYLQERIEKILQQSGMTN